MMMTQNNNDINKKMFPVYFLLSLLIVVMGCSSSTKLFKAPDPVPDDRYHVAPPKERDINVYGEYFQKQVILPLRETLDLSRQFRNLSGNRKQAKNVNAFDGVDNSAWYTNRNEEKQLSLENIAKGPNTGTGPDTSSTWIITRAKAEGVTPGFNIKDAKGGHYVIKFDPPGYAELASGAEVVSTKLFYAAGFNVPENYIVYFDPRILKMGEKVKFTDEKGRKRFMTEQDKENILKRVEIGPNGLVRALASKYLSGVPIGPFKYDGVRKDDFNDIIPHHHRRELRGLRIIAAWLNHFDTKDNNTLDMYITENGKSYVKHYLIDFGATLGSASHSPNHLWRGYQYDFDPTIIASNVLTQGLYVRPWEKQDGVKYPSIGLFESRLFNPLDYKPQAPNPAFDNMTWLDGYWAAKIVMSFTDEQLKTAVEQGQYSSADAKAYLLETIIERRDKIGHLFFTHVNCLDNFKLQQNHMGGQQICFEDMAVKTGLKTENYAEYRYQIRLLPDDKTIQPFKNIENKTCIPVLPDKSDLSNLLSINTSSQKQLEFSFEMKRNTNTNWSKPVKIYLQSETFNTSLKIIGLKRED